MTWAILCRTFDEIVTRQYEPEAAQDRGEWYAYLGKPKLEEPTFHLLTRLSEAGIAVDDPGYRYLTSNLTELQGSQTGLQLAYQNLGNCDLINRIAGGYTGLAWLNDMSNIDSLLTKYDLCLLSYTLCFGFGAKELLGSCCTQLLYELREMCVEEFVKCCVRRHPLLSVLEESILKAYCQATFHGIYRRLDFPFCSSRLIHTIETTYGVRFDKNFFLRVEAATTMETINRSGHTVIPGVCYPTRAGSRTTTAAPVGTTAGNNPHSENPKLEKKPGSIPHSELPEGTTKVTEEDQSGASPTASRAKCGALLVSWKHDEAAGRALIRSLRLRTEVLTALLPPEEEGEGENRAVEI